MPFETAWLFRNPHFQTIWPAFFRSIPKPPNTRERIELPDGDFIDIDWGGECKSDTPVAILFHGLEGSPELSIHTRTGQCTQPTGLVLCIDKFSWL